MKMHRNYKHIIIPPVADIQDSETINMILWNAVVNKLFCEQTFENK